MPERHFLGRPVPADDPRFAPGRRRAHPADEPVRVVVLGDSFSYTDEHGPQLPGTPTLWPTVVRDALEERLDRAVEVVVLARPARTAAEALDLLRRDQHVQHEVLPGAAGVVAAWGSYDHAPAGVPAAARALVPFLRPDPLRRVVRRGLHRTYPVVVRSTGARLARTSTARFTRDHTAALAQLRALAFGAAGVALGPSSHRTPYYGDRHPRFAQRQQLQERLAVDDGWDWVAAWPLVLPHAEALNPDGIHWPAVAHRAVGLAVADRLGRQLLGVAVRPPRPGLADG